MIRIIITSMLVVTATLGIFAGYMIAPEGDITIENRTNVFTTGDYIISERLYAWDASIMDMVGAHNMLGEDYLAGYINLNEFTLAREYYRDLLVKIEEDLQGIRNIAPATWNSTLNSFDEMMESLLDAYDSYTLYIRTSSETYFDAYSTSYDDIIAARADAFEKWPV